MKLEEVAARFKDARREGKGYRAICPCHDDNRQSLSIDPGDNGGVLIYCQVGCPTQAVVLKAGLEMSDLGSSGKSKGSFNIAATYDYRDEKNILLYQSVRLEPKDFRQRSPKPGGGWEWKLNGARRVLYKLAELLAADPAEPVFICEGEKDVDRLRKLGLVATCNVGGASSSTKKTKWLKDYNESLRGRHIVILVDNDEAGEAHSDSIAKSTWGTVASSKLLFLPNLPHKGDVSDWLDSGGTKEGLLQLVDMTGNWSPRQPGEDDEPFEGTAESTSQTTAGPRTWQPKLYTSAELLATDFRLEWIVKKVVVRNQPLIVGGSSKTLKTTVMSDMAISVGMPGQSFLRHFPICRPGGVLFLSGESGGGTTQETLRRQAAAKNIDPAKVNILWGFELPYVNNSGDLSTLRKIIRDNGITMAMIDPAYLCLLAGSNIKAENVLEMGPHLAQLTAVGQETGCTITLCHHARKKLAPGEPPTLEDLSMAGFAEWARQWLLIGRREAYEEDSGIHKLAIRTGGSVGFSGVYAVDIDEGELQDDFTGRKWDVTVTTAKQAREQQKEQRRSEQTQREQEQLSADMAAVVKFLDLAPDGETFSIIRDNCGLKTPRATAAIEQLQRQGAIEKCRVFKGNTSKGYAGFRRPKAEADHAT